MLSIILTNHDREPEILMACLRSLRVSGLEDCEVIVVDDRCTQNQDWVLPYIKGYFRSGIIAHTGGYEGFRLEGYGNPSRAFNVGLLAASEKTVVLLSSDIYMTTGAAKALKRAASYDCPFTPRVVDIDSGAEYCGPSRFFPMPWCLAAPREACLAVGGWDEGYLGGLCFEDNDFVARLGLHCGKILADWDHTVYHQSHFQPAYVVDHPEVGHANDRNREYTMLKWGGIPFNQERTPFDVRQRPDPSGLRSMTFHPQEGALEKAISMTTGLVHARV